MVDAGAAVTLHGLTKRFGDTVAVSGIDLEVPAGSFFGIVGPNGAGKTTTLRMCTGLLRPDSGTVHVNGLDLWADPPAAKAIIGVVPDEPRLFERLTGPELLSYHGVLRGMAPRTIQERSEELLDVLGLLDAQATLVADYSRGMRKKISVACALLHRPSVLFLDEPFEAVDPVSVRALREVLERFVSGGRTVVFSSHVMEVVDRLVEHVAVVADGQVLAHGLIEDVKDGVPLEDRFLTLIGAEHNAAALDWLDRADEDA
ncbi:MAG: ABC transporter ATP-binding protein [Acidimicrobiia bacterium]